MLIQKTLVNQIEITADSVQVRMEICVFNGDTKISSKWHRTSFPLGGSAEVQMEAVNQHLEAMGESRVHAKDVDKIRLAGELFSAIKESDDAGTLELGKPLAEAVAVMRPAKVIKEV